LKARIEAGHHMRRSGTAEERNGLLGMELPYQPIEHPAQVES
jgi:hypothetical protein